MRDSLLAVAGQLDTTLGGPILDEKLGLTSKRRSLYFRFNAEYKMSFLDQFDAASPTECYERRESVVPQQALALHNSALALNVSREVAKQLAKMEDAPAFVTAAFERVLGRAPTADERKRCEEFLRDQTALYAKPEKLTPFPPGPGGHAALDRPGPARPRRPRPRALEPQRLRDDPMRVGHSGRQMPTAGYVLSPMSGLGFTGLASARCSTATASLRADGEARAARRQAALRAEGQERHLAVLHGRRQPPGVLRPEAGARQVRRQDDRRVAVQEGGRRVAVLPQERDGLRRHAAGAA